MQMHHDLPLNRYFQSSIVYKNGRRDYHYFGYRLRLRFFAKKKLKKTHQAKPHAESEQTADVGDERRPGHPLVADDVRRKRVLGSTLKIFLLRH
jgi:hypothetical protein